MPFILPNEDHDLDAAITAAYARLKTFEAEEDGYHTTLNRISELYKLKFDAANIRLEAQQHDDKHTLEVVVAEHQLDLDARPFYKRVDPNTALTVAGNLLVGLAVVKYEQTGVISSKVMSFMKKI